MAKIIKMHKAQRKGINYYGILKWKSKKVAGAGMERKTMTFGSHSM
jgi:hypothetical protein